MNLINRTALRQLILDGCKRRGVDMDRVAGSVVTRYEARLRAWVLDDVERHPTRGKTFSELASDLHGAFAVAGPRK